MKRNSFVFGLLVFGLGIILTGCMSMAIGLAKTMYKDYGVYDESVPAAQQASFRFMFIKVKSFDGKAVNWGGGKANNFGFIKIPAGTHDIVFDWVMEQTTFDGMDYNSASGATTYKYTTTTSSLKDIKVTWDFEGGRNYLLAGAKGPDGNLILRLQDMTNTPSAFYGDEVAAAPKAAKAPTEFEGAWKSPDNAGFVFAGNTWEQTMPPGTLTNEGKQEIKMKGTFAASGGVITLYATGTSVDGGRWVNISAVKSAYIYKYAFTDGKLLLELEGLLPQVAYSKQ
jgi:hypothetical protein